MALHGMNGQYIFHRAELTITCTRTAKSAAPRASSLCFLLPLLRSVRC